MPHLTASIPGLTRRPAPARRGTSPAWQAAALGFALCLCGNSSWAAAPWLCSLSDEATRLVCVVDQEVATDPGAAAVTSSADRAVMAAHRTVTASTTVGATTVTATATTINGTAFPLDAARVYTVDLFAPATEREWVEQLARSTICYRSPGCEVIVLGMDDATGAASPPPQLGGTLVARLDGARVTPRTPR